MSFTVQSFVFILFYCHLMLIIYPSILYQIYFSKYGIWGDREARLMCKDDPNLWLHDADH